MCFIDVGATARGPSVPTVPRLGALIIRHLFDFGPTGFRYIETHKDTTHRCSDEPR
jgi:hypothetical protein